MTIEETLTIMFAAIAISLVVLFSGCAAAPLASSLLGGATLYKSAKEYGPKVEVVLVKLEVNHYQVQYTPEGLKK